LNKKVTFFIPIFLCTFSWHPTNLHLTHVLHRKTALRKIQISVFVLATYVGK
jgi:hypothetical protein